MSRPLRVLLVEDNPMDAELLLRELRRAGFSPDWMRVETEADYRAQLKSQWDIILSDHELPQFSSTQALAILNEWKWRVPFIIVSGTIGEDIAVNAIKNGASDYLLKDRLTRLGPAVELAVRQGQLHLERQRAEAKLAESQERFRQVIENIGEVFWMVDLASRRFIYMSPSYERVWGRTATSLMEDPGQWLESIHPEDRPRVEAAIPGQERGDYDIRYRILRLDGSVRYIHDRAFPVRDGDGATYRVAGLAEDITERYRAEERLKQQAAMLELAQDAIIVRDFHTEQIIFWNQGAERIYEWTAEEALEQPIGELLCIDPGLPMRVAQALCDKGEWHGETKHITKSGKKLIVNIRATLIRDSAGRPQAVLSIASDVTEQRKLEAQFLRAQRMESIGTLASGVAHDLNNILAPIMMSAPLLRANLSPESREGIISTIEISAERGAQIVKQVLAFGRGLEGERKMMSIKASISELAKIMRETFPKDIRVETDTPSELWPIIADPTQVHQILLNLCVNARDAMPNGGRLRMSVRNVLVDLHYAATVSDLSVGRYVLVDVSDDGTGIPTEIIDRIFDPFFTTKGVGKGTGLGLSTVLGIVKSHGGVVHVTSDIGKGTSFHVYMPAAPETEVQPSSPAELEALPIGNGELIIIVDDEGSIRSAAQNVLKTNGYDVCSASDGTEALAIFASNSGRVAAVVTDLMMPFMDGIALIRALRRMQPELPIAASTGLGEKPQLAELKSLGVSSILSKPFGADALLRVVHDLLHPPSKLHPN